MSQEWNDWIVLCEYLTEVHTLVVKLKQILYLFTFPHNSLDGYQGEFAQMAPYAIEVFISRSNWIPLGSYCFSVDLCGISLWKWININNKYNLRNFFPTNIKGPLKPDFFRVYVIIRGNWVVTINLLFYTLHSIHSLLDLIKLGIKVLFPWAQDQ